MQCNLSIEFAARHILWGSEDFVHVDITFLFLWPAVLDQIMHIMHGSHPPRKFLKVLEFFYHFKALESSENQCRFWEVLEI